MIRLYLEFDQTDSRPSLWRWALEDDGGRVREGGWTHAREGALADGFRVAVGLVQNGEYGSWGMGSDRYVEKAGD